MSKWRHKRKKKATQEPFPLDPIRTFAIENVWWYEVIRFGYLHCVQID